MRLSDNMPGRSPQGKRSVDDVRPLLYREVGAGGFSSIDGSIEFYGRINALVTSDMTVLDFGAGRGKGPTEDPVIYRRSLRSLKGKAKMVLGADIDPVIADNPSLDHAVRIDESGGLPFASESIDLILSDNTFEHIRHPHRVVDELDRILRPGGWICARTPNRWGYIAVGAQVVPNSFHTSALRILQPGRKAADVFPTAYRLNTFSTLNQYFPSDRYHDYSYYYNPEPAYFGRSLAVNRIMRTCLRLIPERFSSILMVFKRKV